MVLERSADSYTVLQDELDTLLLYVELEKLRFEKTFTYKVDINGVDTQAVMIPSLLLQPFIENAIWHGLHPVKDRPGEIHIWLTLEAGHLRCEIRDNGIGINKRLSAAIAVPERASMGIALTKQRLRLQTSSLHVREAIQIRDLWDGNGTTGTVVTVLIPVKMIIDQN